MQFINYKTNISSEKALMKATPYLDHAVGPANWQLDLNSADKRLTVFSPATINEEQVIQAIKKAGFRAINLDDYYAIF